MTFRIAFTGERADYDPEVMIGELQLGESIEIFDADLGVWSTDDYERSWLAALQRLVDGAAVSSLITSIPDIRKAAWVETYPLYRVGEEVYVQNEYPVRADPDNTCPSSWAEYGVVPTDTFDPEAPWESVDPRVTEIDGEKLSEWCVALADIREFLESKNTLRP